MSGCGCGLGSFDFGTYDYEEYRSTIRDAMARAAFVSAWADKQDGMGKRGQNPGPGGDWMDIAPETRPDAKAWADMVIAEFEVMNGKTICRLLADAAMAEYEDETYDGVNLPGDILSFTYAKDFGHDLGMMAIGSGVSWFDDHAEFPLKKPYNDYYFGMPVKWYKEQTAKILGKKGRK